MYETKGCKASFGRRGSSSFTPVGLFLPETGEGRKVHATRGGSRGPVTVQVPARVREDDAFVQGVLETKGRLAALGTRGWERMRVGRCVATPGYIFFHIKFTAFIGFVKFIFLFLHSPVHSMQAL